MCAILTARKRGVMPVGVFGGRARGGGRERRGREGGGRERGKKGQGEVWRVERKKGEERVDESITTALQMHIKTSCVYISLSCWT